MPHAHSALRLAVEQQPALFRYGWGALAAAVATAARAALTPLVGPTFFPAITYLPATLLTAWYVGLWPALLSMFLGGIAIAFFFMPDLLNATEPGNQQRVGLALYLGVSLVNIWFASLLEGARNAYLQAAKELTRAQQSLRDNAQRMESIVQHVVDGIITINESGAIESMNAAAEAIFGYAAREMIGQDISVLMPEPYCSEHRGYLRRYLETGERRMIGIGREVKGKRKDGTMFPLDLGVAEFTQQGKRFFTGLVRDITDRRRSEERIRHSEQLLRQVWNSSLDGMRLVDERGIVRMVNAAYCTLVSMAAEELTGQPFAKVYAVPLQSSLMNTFESQYAARTIRSHISSERILHNGQKLQFEVSNSFVERPGEPAWVLSVFRDVTPQRRLEHRINQAQKMEAVGQLAGGIAHDFNNLLTVINGYSELLLSMVPSPDSLRTPLQEISQAGQRAASLTRQLLAFSRRQLIHLETLDLNAVVREAYKLLRRLIGEDIALNLSLAPSLGAVRADAGQIEQILLNLAINARDAMPRGGQLTIETRNVELDADYVHSHLEVTEGQYILLAVSDNGMGMTEEIKSYIFEPFFTTKPVGVGTGLGLATVYSIVKQSGGSIEVYSEPGKGSVFKVYLPQVAPEGKKASSQGPAPSLQGTETILLVEDEETVRMLAHRALTAFGYDVLLATDGHHALQVAASASQRIHLLLTDVVMPGGLSGRELAERLVATMPTLKVIFASGYTDDAVVRHGLLSDAVAFVQKPYTPEGLARKVRTVLDEEQRPLPSRPS